MIKISNIILEIKNIPTISPEMVSDLYSKLYHTNSDLGYKVYEIAYRHGVNVHGDSLFLNDFPNNKLKEFYNELKDLESPDLQEELAGQFEFEYSENGNQFEFGLRDNHEEEFAAESIAILNDKDLHIESFGTNPKYRKQGLGSKLMNEIINFAKARKIIKITLDVRSGNKNAINLYKKFGFNSINKKRGETLDKMELILSISEIKAVPHINLEEVLKLIKLIIQTLVDQDDFSNNEWLEIMRKYKINEGKTSQNLERLKLDGTLKHFYKEIQEFYKSIKDRGPIREIKNK